MHAIWQPTKTGLLRLLLELGTQLLMASVAIILG